MFEIIGSSTFRSIWIVCEGDTKVKYVRENHKRGNEVQMEGSSTGVKL